MEDYAKSRRFMLPSLKRLSIYRKNIIEKRFEAKIILCPNSVSPANVNLIDFVKRTPSPMLSKKNLGAISTGSSMNQPFSNKELFSRKFLGEANGSPAKVISFYSYKKKKLKLQPKKISSIKVVKKEPNSVQVSSKFMSPVNKFSDFSCQIDL